MSTAADRITKFCDEYVKMRGIDPDLVYGLHMGDDRAAQLTITDLRELVALVSPGKGREVDSAAAVRPAPLAAAGPPEVLRQARCLRFESDDRTHPAHRWYNDDLPEDARICWCPGQAETPGEALMHDHGIQL